MGQKASSQAHKSRAALDEDGTRVTIYASSLTCPVCYGVFARPPSVLACGHHLCRSCGKHMLAQAKEAGLNVLECPLCRVCTTLPSRNSTLATSYGLQAVVDSLVVVTDEEGLPTLDANLRYRNKMLKEEMAGLRERLESAKQKERLYRDRERGYTVLLTLAIAVACYACFFG